MSTTTTRSGTETTTITAGDVRQVMALTGQEIAAICNAAARIARDFDADSALVDCSLLALNDVITAIRLQFYVGQELVREYAYVIADQPREAYGPSPDRPPLGPIPDGARVRLIVNPNGRVCKEFRDGWFRRLGWTDAAPLRMPDGATHQAYGIFTSGGYAVERQLLVNPKYDRPVSVPTGQGIQRPRKEG